jgi:hypothetical protein
LFLEPAPPNVLTINDEFDAAMVLKWLQMNRQTERKRIINKKRKDLVFIYFKDSILIYGATLESYCCINALLANGISSNSIKLIIPPEYQNVRNNG